MQSVKDRTIIYHMKNHFQVEWSDLNSWALRNVGLQWWGMSGSGAWCRGTHPSKSMLEDHT
jgi:hypothetical protein